MIVARPLRILVVDDDPAMVGAITALVGTEGHQVITAYDGLTAVKRFREEAPDLVLLDLAMPGPDGLAMPLGAQSQTIAPTATEAVLKRPTDFRTRIEARNEYQNLAGDGYRNIFAPRLDYAVKPYFALRLELPHVTYDPGAGAQRVSGQGDLLTRATWRAIQKDGFALVLASDLIFDTADDDRLGYGKTVLAPHVFADFDIAKYNSIFFPNIQHYFSVAGSGNRRDVNFTTLKPNLLTRWPNKIYTFFEPQFTIDWENNDKVGLTAELEVGKILSKNIAAWARPGVGLINRNEVSQVYEWNFELGMRYIF